MCSLLVLVFLGLWMTEHNAVKAMPDTMNAMFERLNERFPSLDPISFDHYPFEFSKGSCSVRGSFDNVVIRGLSAMDLDIKDMDTDAMSYHLAVNFPVLSVEAKYKYSANICEFSVPETTGKFTLSVQNVTIVTRTNFTKVDDVTQMDYLDLSVDFDDVKFEIDSVMGNAKLGQLVTSVMKTHGKEAFYTLKPILKQGTQNAIKKAVNQFIIDSKKNDSTSSRK